MDDEHLRLLRIGYFVMAGMKAFMSLFGLLYAGIGLTAFTFAHAAPPTRPAGTTARVRRMDFRRFWTPASLSSSP